MASTYVNDLRLNEMATGDGSGTWGTTTNTNLELIGEALGFGTEAITTNADTHTTTVADGATDPGRAMYLKYTGTLDSACTITIAPNTISRMHFIENGTSGSQNIIISQGSGANITIPAGDTKAVYLDGAGSGAAVVDAFASLSTVDLKVQDDLTVTDDATIGGTLGVTGVTTLGIGMDIDGTDDLRLRFLNSSTFKGGIQTATSSGDMISGSAVDDLAIRSQGDIRFATGGNTERMNILDTGINITGTISSTVTDNSDNLTLTSTDADANVGPNLNLYRNSGSPADNDVTGVIVFNGRNDNSQDVIYARQLSYIKDASDGTEDGQLTLQTMVAGTIRDRLNITPTEIILNEDSQDLDFRVESDNDANAFFVQGNTGNVALGHTSPDQILHLKDTGDTYIVLEGGSSDANGGILFHNSSGTEQGTMLFDLDDNYMRILVSTAQGSAFNAATVSTWRALEIFQDRGVTNSGSGIAFRSQSGTAPSGIVSVAGNTTGGIESLAFITSTSNTSAERMRITDAGLFGMGDSPTNLTTEILTITTPASGGGQGIAFKRLDTNTDQVCGQIRWSNNSTDDLAFIKTKTDGANTASAIQFFTNGGSGVAERARISKNGVFLLGVTSVAGPGASVDSNTSEFGRGYINLDRDDTASIDQILFGKNGSIAGRITTTSSTTYTTTSDYRRKENITPVVNGLERVQKLNPVSYTWIDDEAKIVEEGFLAHEVQEAGWETGVGGEKDGEDVQSMDYGRITPLLVKAIQEQQTTIENLTARLNTLEG